MIEHQDADFLIAVTVSGPPRRRMSLLEKTVVRLGGPQPVMKVCERLTYASVALAMAFLLTWLFVLQGVIQDRLNPSTGQALFLSLGWAPMMMGQLLLGALRYACLTVTIKATEDIMDVTSTRFFEHVRLCVIDAIETYKAATAPPEKPTLQ
jgi:hypothetical protein